MRCNKRVIIHLRRTHKYIEFKNGSFGFERRGFLRKERNEMREKDGGMEKGEREGGEGERSGGGERWNSEGESGVRGER